METKFKKHIFVHIQIEWLQTPVFLYILYEISL